MDAAGLLHRDHGADPRVAHEAGDVERRFGGLARLYGLEGAARIRAAHVAVVGIGGVGSWAAEALARSGVGRLTLIDLDHVAESNVNRQVHALTDTLGQAKVQAMRERIQGARAGQAAAIIEHPDVRRMLMDMKARTEAMRALAYFCAGQIDRAAGHADRRLVRRLRLVGGRGQQQRGRRRRRRLRSLLRHPDQRLPLARRGSARRVRDHAGRQGPAGRARSFAPRDPQ